MFSCLVAMRSRAHEHSAAAAAAAAAAATLSSTRATTPDSSSTRTPVVAVVVLLRIARAAPERTSMSRCPSMAYYTAKNGHGTTNARLLERNENERQTRARRGQAVTGTRAPSNSSSSTQRHSSNTRLGQHSYAYFCGCCTSSYCSSLISSTINNIAGNAYLVPVRDKIRQIHDESHRDTTKKTIRYARRRYCVFSCLVANQLRTHEHSAAAAILNSSSSNTQQHSIRAALVRLLLQLLYCCVLLEQHSSARARV